MGWWKTHKELKTEIGRLEHQIKLMQEHISVQNNQEMSLKRKVRELELLLDIAHNPKKY